MKNVIYVCERCGTEWDIKVGFCPMCYTDLIPKDEYNKRKNKNKNKIKIVEEKEDDL